jgi:hypothetical protein
LGNSGRSSRDNEADVAALDVLQALAVEQALLVALRQNSERVLEVI